MGHFEGPIIETMLAEPRFAKGPNDFDVCLKVRGPDGSEDWWSGEFSNDYGKGTMAHLRQREITMNNLHKIGFQGDDLSTLDKQLVGKVIPFSVEEVTTSKGTKFMQVKYIGGNDFGPKKLDSKSVASRLAALKADAPLSSAPDTNVDPWG
jgi:hypothetical protein